MPLVQVVPVGIHIYLMRQSFILLVCSALAAPHLYTLLKQIHFQSFNIHVSSMLVIS